MNIADVIQYKGRYYPVFEVNIKGIKLISVESLSNAISADGTFEDADDEGKHIDETIYFYIPDTMTPLKRSDVEIHIKQST